MDSPAETLARIAYIVQKGKALEKQIDSLKDYLNSEFPDSVNAQLRSTDITNSFKEYSRYNDELTLLQEDHPQLDVFPHIESNFYDVVAQVNRLQDAGPIANSTQMNTTNLTITEHHDLPRLPVIEIPSFNGNHEDWVVWKHGYMALVHDRPNTSNYVKHSLLLKSLSGLAYDIVKQFSPSDANYNLAWKALCDAYDQRRMLVSEHIDALLDLPKLHDAKEADLSALINKARQHVSMLEHMEILVNEEFVVRIIERCLPKSVVARWQDRLQGDKIAKLDDLFKFVQDTIFRLHQLRKLPSSSYSSNKRSGDKVNLPRGKMLRSDARSLVTSNTNSDTQRSYKKCCPKCNEAHHLFVCPIFNGFSSQERWVFVKQNKICRNCLYSHALPCRSDKRCKKCGKDHHTLLHSDKKSKNSNTEGSQRKGEPSSSSSNATQA